MTLPSARFGALQRLEVFRPLTLPEIDAFATVARERWLEPGDVLVREGDPGASLAFVVQGELSVRLGDAPDLTAEVAALGAGTVVGEGAFVDPAPRSATVVATLPTVVVELDRGGFASLLRDHPRVASRFLGFILADVARRLHAVDRRIAIELGEVSAYAPLAPADAPAPRAASAGAVTPAALRACGLALGCTDGELAALIGAGDARRYEPGEALSLQGSVARSCFLIVAGEVSVVKSLLASERVLTTLGPGTIAGQVALIDRARRSSTLRAATAVVALELGADAFDRMVHACDRAALGLQRHAAAVSARQLREADRRLAAVLARSTWLPEVDDPTPRTPTAPLRQRREDDLHYLQAAVGEVAMDLDVIELSDDDLGPAPPPRRDFFTPPPLPHRPAAS